MAHPTRIQAYALAEHECQELERRLERAQAERGKHHAEVYRHLAERGPVYCTFNNTDEALILHVRDGSIEGIIGRPCFIPTEGGEDA